MSNAIMALTAEGAVTFESFQPLLEAITGSISVGTVVAVLAGVVGSGIGLVFMWWGVRKLARSLMAAFKKGKLSF